MLAISRGRGFLACTMALALSALSGSVEAKFSVLYAFTGNGDGSEPEGTLIRDDGGNLYGTTYYSNSGCEGFGGCGTVYMLAPGGVETVLYAFKGGSDGAHPNAGLIPDGAGNFYGTTENGGGGTCDAGFGCGTVFKLNLDGTETVLHAFKGKDGTYPFAGLISADSKNFFGTTFGSIYNFGTVFSIRRGGKFSVLHTFEGGSDGVYPTSSLFVDIAGNLYGTTVAGGGGTDCGGDLGCGTVFRIAPDGRETVLYAFSGGSDGAYPEASLIADGGGNLYGTTSAGGGTCNCGTVFKIDPNGGLTVLHSFTGADGSRPFAPVLMDRSGNLYGSTIAGGENHDNGTIYELAPDGTETVLHSFRRKDGEGPGGLIADNKGRLYGTASAGGPSGGGTVFRLNE